MSTSLHYVQVWIDEDWPLPPVFRPLATPGETLKKIKTGIADWLVQGVTGTGNVP